MVYYRRPQLLHLLLLLIRYWVQLWPRHVSKGSKGGNFPWQLTAKITHNNYFFISCLRRAYQTHILVVLKKVW